MSAYKLVTCPYDEVHKVKENRIAVHISKCRENHLGEEKFTCPFNATHIYPKQEMNYHLLHCPNRAPLDRALAHDALEKNNPFKGHTGVPSYTESIPTVTDEVWDDEYSEPAPGFVAGAPPPCAIIEPRPLSKPAERRRLYAELHRMPSESEKSNQSPDINSNESSVPLNRQPKVLSQIENKKTQTQCGLGLGRGKPAGQPTRIAANIFPSNSVAPPPAASSSANYSAALTASMANLGLGRGFPVNAAKKPMDNEDEDDEFPALGCGRGSYRSSKNGIRYPGSKN